VAKEFRSQKSGVHSKKLNGMTIEQEKAESAIQR